MWNVLEALSSNPNWSESSLTHQNVMLKNLLCGFWKRWRRRRQWRGAMRKTCANFSHVDSTKRTRQCGFFKGNSLCSKTHSTTKRISGTWYVEYSNALSFVTLTLSTATVGCWDCTWPFTAGEIANAAARSVLPSDSPTFHLASDLYNFYTVSYRTSIREIYNFIRKLRSYFIRPRI